MAQFAVAHGETNELFGLVTGYNFRPDVRSCYFAFQRAHRPGLPSDGGELISGAALMLEYLFNTFDLRRVYVEVPEYNRYIIDGLLQTFMKLEAEISEQLWHGGRYWSMLIGVVERAAWRSFAGNIFEPLGNVVDR